MGKSSNVILSLGSNCGDRWQMVSNAKEWIANENGLSMTSQTEIYETPALQGVGEPYMNAVVECECYCSFDELNARLKAYEMSCGRDTQCRERGMVPIDIDIVVWDDVIVRRKDFNCDFFKKGYDVIKSTKLFSNI